MAHLLDNFFKDKKGRIVLWQTPNNFLLVWAVCTLLRHVLSAGIVRQTVGYIGFGSIVVWALLEIFQGATYFRRSLGGIVLIASLYGKFLG